MRPGRSFHESVLIYIDEANLIKLVKSSIAELTSKSACIGHSSLAITSCSHDCRVSKLGTPLRDTYSMPHFDPCDHGVP